VFKIGGIRNCVKTSFNGGECDKNGVELVRTGLNRVKMGLNLSRTAKKRDERPLFQVLNVVRTRWACLESCKNEVVSYSRHFVTKVARFHPSPSRFIRFLGRVTTF